jgi:hypothetical protein
MNTLAKVMEYTAGTAVLGTAGITGHFYASGLDRNEKFNLPDANTVIDCRFYKKPYSTTYDIIPIPQQLTPTIEIKKYNYRTSTVEFSPVSIISFYAFKYGKVGPKTRQQSELGNFPLRMTMSEKKPVVEQTVEQTVDETE